MTSALRSSALRAAQRIRTTPPNTAVLSRRMVRCTAQRTRSCGTLHRAHSLQRCRRFADAVVNDKETPVTGEDGLYRY